MTTSNETRRPQPARCAEAAGGEARPIDASPAGIDAAIEDPGLPVEQMQLVLRNHRLVATQLERIGRNPAWTRHQQIKKALVVHPRTPLSLSGHLLPHLFWNDLSDAAARPTTHPVIRRRAERLLVRRTADLGAGERINLARRATRGVIAAFLKDEDPRVLAALLDNPRLTENEAVLLASDETTPVESLAGLADHPGWSRRRDVRLALLANARTPVSAALGLLRGASTQDLQQLLENDKVPKIVRIGAARRLSAATGDSAGRRSGDRPA